MSTQEFEQIDINSFLDHSVEDNTEEKDSGAFTERQTELINQLLYENKLSMDQIESIGVASPGTISNGHIYSTNLGLNNFVLMLS